MGTGTYIANIDSDDWWESNYLEALIGFLEKNRLDLAVTGTINYFEETRTSQIMRKLDVPIVLSIQQFAENYPQLWTFPSTMWASIMRTELFRKADFQEVLALKISNGADTASMLKYIAQCERIGIDNTALYNYRIRQKQISRQYNQQRFPSNTYVYEEIKSFLERNGAFDIQKQNWLKYVHLNSMNTTLVLLNQSNLSADDKIAECARIITHPLTCAVLDSSCPERDQWFSLVWEITLHALKDNALTDTDSLHSILTVLAPRCGSAVTKNTIALFRREWGLLEALGRDDWDALVEGLMGLIAEKRYTKQFDLGAVLRSLLPPENPLRAVSDIRFLQQYTEISMLLLCENYPAALGEMTELLLEKRKIPESFLRLYLVLASRQGEEGAFLFGMINLARELLRQRRTEEAASIVKDLEEMGIEENPELEELRRQLKEDI